MITYDCISLLGLNFNQLPNFYANCKIRTNLSPYLPAGRHYPLLRISHSDFPLLSFHIPKNIFADQIHNIDGRLGFGDAVAVFQQIAAASIGDENFSPISLSI